MPIGDKMTIIGLLNGMIGGTILILPLLGLETGYLLILPISALIGSISCYTAYLIILHLGIATNINQSVLQHFQRDKKYAIMYNTFIGFSLIPILLTYFNLSCIQIEGLIHKNFWIPIIMAIILLILTVFTRKFDLAQRFLAMGIVSIISYIIFLSWAFITAPSGNNTFEPIKFTFSNYASSLLMAYAVHDFVVQIIIKNPNKDNYPRIIIMTYLLGTLAYTYIAYGSFAILNRTSRVQDPSTIEDYFSYGSIQIKIIQIIYLVHLLTVFPQYLIISKIRFMQVCSFQQPPQLELKQIAYYIGIILLCFACYSTHIKLSILIQINGSIIGFIYVVFIPIWIHLKCVYYDHTSGNIINSQTSEISHNKCQCNVQYSSKNSKRAQLIWLVFIILITLAISCYTMYLMIFQQEQQISNNAQGQL